MSKPNANAFLAVCVLVCAWGCGPSNKERDVSDHKTNGPKAGFAEKSNVDRLQELIDDQVAAVNAASDRINEIQDEITALQAAKQLKKCAEQMRGFAKDLKSLSKVTKKEHAQLSGKGMAAAKAKNANANKYLTEQCTQGKLSPQVVEAIQEALIDFGKASLEISAAYAALGL
jgi:TolA-binding protein